MLIINEKLVNIKEIGKDQIIACLGRDRKPYSDWADISPTRARQHREIPDEPLNPAGHSDISHTRSASRPTSSSSRETRASVYTVHRC